jgi:hypothetical protein
MKTLLDKEKNRLVKKFHTLLNRYGIDNETKLDILAQYNVTSSVYLDCGQLLDLCGRIERMHNPKAAEQEMWRRRVMGAIGGWLRAMNRADSGELIKGIACRASGRASFNDIPVEQLRSLYSAFKKKQKDLLSVEYLTADELNLLALKN